MTLAYPSIRTRDEDGALFATLDAGPLNQGQQAR